MSLGYEFRAQRNQRHEHLARVINEYLLEHPPQPGRRCSRRIPTRLLCLTLPASCLPSCLLGLRCLPASASASDRNI